MTTKLVTGHKKADRPGALGLARSFRDIPVRPLQLPALAAPKEEAQLQGSGPSSVEASPGVAGRAAIQQLARGCPEHPEGPLRLHPVMEKRAWDRTLRHGQAQMAVEERHSMMATEEGQRERQRSGEWCCEAMEETDMFIHDKRPIGQW